MDTDPEAPKHQSEHQKRKWSFILVIELSYESKERMQTVRNVLVLILVVTGILLYLGAAET